MSDRGFLASATTAISVTDATGNVALSGKGESVLVQNKGAKWVYFKLFDSSQTVAASIVATTSDTPLGPGAGIAMDKGTFDYIAAICDSTESSTIKMTTGGGNIFLAQAAEVAISGMTVTADTEGTATAAAPSYSEGTSNNLSMTLAGFLRSVVQGLGTAGTASGGVMTVQGVASMTPVLATLSGTNNIATVSTVTAVTAVTDITNTVRTRPTACSVGTVTSVSDTNSDTTILAANANRIGATVYNTSTAILYLLLSNATSSSTNFTVAMAASSYYEVPFGYTGVLKGIWATDQSGAAVVTEFTA